MIGFFVFRKNHRKVGLSMIKVVKKGINVEELLRKRLTIICDFSNIASAVIKGKIRGFEKQVSFILDSIE